MDGNRERGEAGELAAVTYLEQHGYVILERNVHMRHGEIDIVAREGGDLVFLEVKARSSDAFGTPAEALTPTKLRHLATAAREYTYANLLTEESTRCDVVAVTIHDEADPEVELLRNAAELGAILET